MPHLRVFLARLSLGLFAVSLLSGLLPAFAYHVSDPFGSVQRMTFLIPYGAFFRQLHYFSSELFLIVLLAHIAFEVARGRTTLSLTAWLYSVLGAAAVIGLMFSGFVLKGDQRAVAAAQVALHLMHQTPLLDRLVPLVRDTEVFVHKFFIWHVLFLPLLLGGAIYGHIGRIAPGRPYWILGLGMGALGLLVCTMPVDIAPDETVEHLRGPWFFQGAENLLQMGVPSRIVNAIVALPFGLLALYPFAGHRAPRWIGAALLLWLSAYGIVSVAWWL
jgi:ubiquinol-cytochrome c reductase cytochrome b subunit